MVQTSKGRGGRLRPTEIDAAVGQKLLTRRRILGLSQNDLASLCFVSPQMVHKYEIGASGMSASRLVRFADALGVPVDWFFEGLTVHEEIPDDMLNLLIKPENYEVISKFDAIEDPELKEAILSMLRTYESGKDNAVSSIISN